jgi:hypothetical protein
MERTYLGGKEDVRMKRFLLVVVGGLLLWQVPAVAAEVGFVPQRDDCDGVENVHIVLGPFGFEYLDKETAPVPEIQWGCPFTITVEFKGALEGQSITLSHFRAVTQSDGAVKAEDKGKWKTIEPRTLRKHIGDGSPLEGELEGAKFPKAPWGEAKFATSGTLAFLLEEPEGTLENAEEDYAPRLILFRVTFVTKNGTTVTFDPPWSEKKP